VAAISLTNPVDGQIVEADLHADNYTAIESVVNGGIDTTNISPTAAIIDTQLASANNSTYRLIESASSRFRDGDVVGTYVIFEDDRALTGTGIGASSRLFYVEATDYSVLAKATQFNLDVVLHTNNTAPAGTFVFGFYPVTSVAGGALLANVTIGTVVTGSTVTFTTPAANTMFHDNSGDFAIPANGHYAFGCVTSGGTLAANSWVPFTCRLRVRNT
jgi:hypothetical protein